MTEWCTGPETYVPPPAQGRFAGSRREARGAVMRSVVRTPASLEDIVRSSGLGTERIEAATSALVADGLLSCDDQGVFSPAD